MSLAPASDEYPRFNVDTDPVAVAARPRGSSVPCFFFGFETPSTLSTEQQRDAVYAPLFDYLNVVNAAAVAYPADVIPAGSSGYSPDFVAELMSTAAHFSHNLNGLTSLSSWFSAPLPPGRHRRVVVNYPRSRRSTCLNGPEIMAGSHTPSSRHSQGMGPVRNFETAV
ncbi:hypothetical protein HPB50_003026 [Hyalomma asiaticum]|uniref:Uncharacterized protein n=1 Tax=Hyalomma asiaticum TaxID=266040 RepID=A0ACB7RRX2_HYAAI|nr:hypothetical protein HPB50_003026 [Hyalomma asiaticum]